MKADAMASRAPSQTSERTPDHDGVVEHVDDDEAEDQDEEQSVAERAARLVARVKAVAASRSVQVELRLRLNFADMPIAVELTDLNADTPGSGGGTAVMHELEAAADQEELAVFVWPGSLRNTAFYRRFGFVDREGSTVEMTRPAPLPAWFRELADSGSAEQMNTTNNSGLPYGPEGGSAQMEAASPPPQPTTARYISATSWQHTFDTGPRNVRWCYDTQERSFVLAQTEATWGGYISKYADLSQQSVGELLASVKDNLDRHWPDELGLDASDELPAWVATEIGEHNVDEHVMRPRERG